MNKKLKQQTKEALTSVLPITVIVLLISVVVDIPIGTIVMFLVGAAMLIAGMGFFSLGADMALIPMGEGIGMQMTKSRKLWVIALVTLVMGVMITVAEPDLQILAHQMPAISTLTLIITVAVGAGLFLVFGIFRILFRGDIIKMLILFYGLVFLLSFFVPREFLPVAFDSGGVTTGAITVPFIMAMGLSVAAVRSDKDAKDDSFGFIAISSIGPILAVLALGIWFRPTTAEYVMDIPEEVYTMRDVAHQFFLALPQYIKEVALAVSPIIVVLVIIQLFSRRYHKHQLIRIIVGFVYTLIGLVLFLTGVNVGFIPVGYKVGFDIAATSFKWFLVPLGMLIGYFIVAAEPAVHVLNKQVEEVTEGAIPALAMNVGLSIGVSVSLGLTMIRVLTGISIYWFLIPGYFIALTLSFFVPKIFTGIAFDSGGVASGSMASMFLLPFTIGVCQAVGGNILTDAFGVVAMVAMTPLIAIQIMGFVYKMKTMKADVAENIDVDTDSYDDIIDFEEEPSDG